MARRTATTHQENQKENGDAHGVSTFFVHRLMQTRRVNALARDESFTTDAIIIALELQMHTLNVRLRLAKSCNKEPVDPDARMR